MKKLKMQFLQNGIIQHVRLPTLRFRIIGGAGIVGGLETLVYINNRGGVGNFSMY